MQDPLYKQFDSAKQGGFVRFDAPVPAHISANLSDHIQLRPYQIEALNRYLYYTQSYQNRAVSNCNLLFNMATGSGKTVIMAALILDLYKQGYNKFIFFVNRGNIVEKTIDNFTNPASNKYLFADTLSVDGQTPAIRAVETLNSSNSGDIEILFTTIQKMHGDLFTPREGRITLEDIADQKIVMLSDEAHHINAWTTGESLSGEEAEDKRTWEHAVQKIFKQNADNVLLEFTATIDLGIESIKQKYNDVLLYKYDLKQFRQDKYSKEIILYSLHDDIKQIMLHALLISQYRLLVAESYGLLLKPVILFKSKRIAASTANQQMFIELIQNLSEAEVLAALTSSAPLARLGAYLEHNHTTVANFIKELKIAFDPARIRNVNDQKEATELQIDINRLENIDNEIRVLFAVDKLNEGWDVLNLFDIVRLYDTRDGNYSRGGEYKPGKTTVMEAQLIGRGARYWPFSYNQEPADKRKFDSDLGNELRIIEELYYHSPRDTDYLIEIRSALVKSGLMDQQEPKTVTLRLKESFKNSPAYQQGYVYVNSLQDNPHADKKSALDYLDGVTAIEVKLATHITTLDTAYSDAAVSRVATTVAEYTVQDIPKHVVSKALDRDYKFYNFASLHSYLPTIKSKDDLVAMLAPVVLRVSGSSQELAAPSPETWLKITQAVLQHLKTVIQQKDAPKIGSTSFEPKPMKALFKDKKLLVVENASGASGKKMSEESEVLYLDLSTRAWYAHEEDYGTSYEKKLVKLIDSHIEALQKKWDELYLIRNEREFKLYSFDDGSVFMPDYLLYLKSAANSQTYYVFLEPKGENIEVGEAWKEQFLLAMKDTAQPVQLFEDSHEVHIIGLPFYQPASEQSYEPKNPEFSEGLQSLAS